FSKDKSPYKTNVAMEFWHRRGGKKSYTGLYLHLALGDSFAGAGIWHPDPPTLNRVRRAIVSRPEAWKQVKESGLKIEGEFLKHHLRTSRPPTECYLTMFERGPRVPSFVIQKPFFPP